MAWKLNATPPIIKESTLLAFNEAKNSLKSWFIISKALLAHGLADSEAIGTAER